MKKIILKQLTLTNWRGEKSRTTIFNPLTTTISGANGLGKSRHFDAFIWLLFGKDSQGRDNYEIKTRIDGNELHNVECSVVGQLDIDGQQLTLKRELSEKWVKPKGATQPVFKGNETLCWWNEVPVNVTEYKARIKEIIDESIFKMITNPKYFFNLKWQDQREILFQLAGSVTDLEIASTRPQYKALIDKISGKGLSDFKRELSARKKRLKSELSEIQPRIDQTQKLMPESQDFTSLEAQLFTVEASLAQTEKALTDAAEQSKQQNQSILEQQNRINKIRQDMQQVLWDEENKVQEAAFKARSERKQIEEQIKTLQTSISTKENHITQISEDITRLKENISKATEQANLLRQDWYKENETTYNGLATCPHCRQPLPEAMKAQALKLFNTAKQEHLQEISRKGKQQNENIRTYQHQIEESNSRKTQIRIDIDTTRQELQAAKAALEALPIIINTNINPENIKAYTTLRTQLEELQAQKDTAPSTHSHTTQAIQDRKKSLTQQRDQIRTALADRDRIRQFEQQITHLETKGKNLAQQIADVESEEYTLHQFTKTKIDECEKRINHLFNGITFRLFDYNQDDTTHENPIECCIPLVDGHYYATSNTATQLNAGLAVINVLTHFHGITAPIFIDERESVNQIIDTQSQIINLVVTQDKKLIIQ